MKKKPSKKGSVTWLYSKAQMSAMYTADMERMSTQIGVLKDQLADRNKRIYELLDELSDLKKKTAGNLGVLVPELQKERNEYMQYYNGALKTMEDQARRIQRLQDIVNAYIDGRLL